MFDWFAFAAECPLPIATIRDDAKIVFANRAFGRLVGVGLGSLDQQDFVQRLPERNRPPAGVSVLAHLAQLASRTDGRPKVLSVLHASGTEIELEWTVVSGHASSGRSVVVLLLSPRPERFAEVAADNDDVGQLHQLIFDHAPTAIFHTDERGVINACNERFVQLIGSTRAQLIGLLTTTLPNHEIVKTIETALRGEFARFDGEYTSVTGGRTRHVRLFVAPIRSDGDAIAGLVGLIDDATEEQRALRLATRADRFSALGSLAAGVVHELQNPLAFVLTGLDLVLRKLEDPRTASLTEIRELVSGARSGVSRVAETVRDLRTFAKSDDAKRVPVRVKEAAELAINLTDHQLAHRAIVTRDLDPAPIVFAAETKLVQLFVNLLSYAVPPGSVDVKVKLSVLQQGDLVRIRVAFRGGPSALAHDIGNQLAASGFAMLVDSNRAITVPEGEAKRPSQRSFEPFHDEATAGTGLLLATCHGIVTSLGGRIEFEEAGDDTVVVVELPACRSDQTGPRSSRSSGEIRALTRGKVLLVDDEERLADTLKVALSPLHDVEVFTRGKPALARLLEADFDVILCDLMLPDLSGVDVFGEATKQKPYLAERFVFLTGGAFEPRARAFLQAIDNPRLDKPFELKQLEELLAEQVSLARGS